MHARVYSLSASAYKHSSVRLPFCNARLRQTRCTAGLFLNGRRSKRGRHRSVTAPVCNISCVRFRRCLLPRCCYLFQMQFSSNSCIPSFFLIKYKQYLLVNASEQGQDCKNHRTESAPQGERRDGKGLQAITLRADLPKLRRRVRRRPVITAQGITRLLGERTCLKW